MLVKIHSKDENITLDNVMSIFVKNKNDTLEILSQHQDMVYLASEGAKIEIKSGEKKEFAVEKSAIISIMNNEVEISMI
jgi:hypothetical protein